MTFWQYYTLNRRNHSAVIGFLIIIRSDISPVIFWEREMQVDERHP